MQITQTDFSVDCMKMTQEYLMYFKEFSCNKTENMQVRCVPRFIQCFLNIPHFSAKINTIAADSEIYQYSTDNDTQIPHNVHCKKMPQGVK